MKLIESSFLEIQKIKLLMFTMLAINISMAMQVAHAEHSILNLNLSEQTEKEVEEYLTALDTFATFNAIIFKDKTDKEIIEITRYTVTEEFKDPESAKFRNEKIFRKKITLKNIETGETTGVENGVYVCGEVNGKNSYGAYTGYKNYWGGQWAKIEEESSSLFAYALLHYCHSIPSTN